METEEMENLVGNNQGQLIAMNTEATLSQISETYFTIAQLAEFSGIKSHTIRIWEKRFAFLRPRRTEASRRVYNTEQVIFFLQVCLLKQSGYRMSHIAKMDHDEKDAAISGIRGPQKFTGAIHQLIGYMAAMDSVHFAGVLDECVDKWGIHDTIKFVIIPFSERIGLFDSPEKRSYRQNIFLVLDCIKQKIYLAIERAVSGLLPMKQQTILLFLSGSSSELPLLYLHYLVKKEGFATIYLGKHFSLPELDLICKRKKPDYIVTHLPGNYRYNDLGEFIKSLPGYLPGTHFISAGRSFPVGKNVSSYRHVDNCMDIIASLKDLPAC